MPRSRRVHLPAGAAWTDLRTGAEHEGGQWVVVDAPIGRIPVSVRDGALADPVGPDVEAATRDAGRLPFVSR